MAFTGPVEDRLAIRELYGSYADCSWRGDREGWLALWVPDGRWTSHLFDVAGHQALRAQWDDLWQYWNGVAFLGEIGAMEITGDVAQVRSFARETVSLQDGGIYRLAGRYEDRLARVDGCWLFARRDYHMIFDEPPELGA